jgi:hypothetical protein
MQVELRIEEIQKSSALYVRVLERSDEQQVEMKIAHTSDSEKNDHANADSFANHDVHMKSMLRARSFDLLVSHQINNHLRKLSLIRVARTIEQRQRHDDSAYENAENRSAHRLKRLSSHIAKDSERRNAYSAHSFSFISFANRCQRSIDKA